MAMIELIISEKTVESKYTGKQIGNMRKITKHLLQQKIYGKEIAFG